MSYTLTLTNEERRAIDWIGLRYPHGDELYSALCEAKWSCDTEWDTDDSITFNIPEHVAWRIADIAEEGEHRWDCFGSELVQKLERFLEGVV